MKKYKEMIRSGLRERNFEIEAVFDNESDLPWWIEERWSIRRSFDQAGLYVIFLTDRQWESGPKTVSEVLLSEGLPSSYTEEIQGTARLSLIKGKMDERLSGFWKELDHYLNNEQ
jgi:hypothetical protein